MRSAQPRANTVSKRVGRRRRSHPVTQPVAAKACGGNVRSRIAPGVTARHQVLRRHLVSACLPRSETVLEREGGDAIHACPHRMVAVATAATLTIVGQHTEFGEVWHDGAR